MVNAGLCKTLNCHKRTLEKQAESAFLIIAIQENDNK